ncbi:MAG: hypothetical protein EB128_04640 [Betaproteobacteria bacterium]|nr:hypothetical protein [Betaproteobacteria bacterium]
MIRISELKLPLSALPVEVRRAADAPSETDEDRIPPPHPEEALRVLAAKALGLDAMAIDQLHVFKRSFDARKADLLAVFIVDITLKNPAAEDSLLKQFSANSHIQATPNMTWQAPCHAPSNFGLEEGERPVVVGFGPCGIFAALSLAQMGFKPIVIERGSPVRQRTKDTWGLWRKQTLNPESNVQFGEGGAGTFSDGKLYSQIKDPRHLGRKVMNEFVQAGAPSDILFAAHPHIGTFKLVKVVENLRGVYMEAKAFSVGVRIEHPQSVIDAARWGRHAGHPLLGAADYKLVHHAQNGRAVYSFCMCPGGTVVAATSEPGRVVTNGMSQYSRNERNANAGMVVAIDPEDYPLDVAAWQAAFGEDDGLKWALQAQAMAQQTPKAYHPLSGIVFQRLLESKAFVAGGENYTAPGQLVGDFLHARASKDFGAVQPSYKPGVRLGDLSQVLPAFAVQAMREALPVFGRKIKGYDMQDAVLTGVETRTSSPLKITRGENFQSLNTQGLYPAGEGASYAGGILSAGVDGIKVAEALAQSMAKKA